MSVIETVSDVDNTFLSRREITCSFAGVGGRLKKLEAAGMVAKKFKINGKVVIPVRLQPLVGKPQVTGTFYVYDDEALAKRHVNPTIFARMERARAAEDAGQEGAAAEGQAPGEKPG